jgi:hypothetical protein
MKNFAKIVFILNLVAVATAVFALCTTHKGQYMLVIVAAINALSAAFTAMVGWD